MSSGNKTLSYCTPVIYASEATPIINQEVYYQSEVPQQISVIKKKSRIYKQKYLTQWEQDERFKDWIVAYRGDEDFAFCTICNCKILARTASVTAHHNSSKHKKKLLLNGLEWTLSEAAPHNIKLAEEENSDSENRSLPNFFEPEDGTSSVLSDVDANFLNDDFDEELPMKSENTEVIDYSEETKRVGKRSRRGRPRTTISPYKSPTPSGKKGRRKSKCPHCNHSEVECKKGGDSCLIYGKYVGNELRQITDEVAIKTTKLKINSILMEAKLGKYNKKQTGQNELKSENSENSMITGD